MLIVDGSIDYLWYQHLMLQHLPHHMVGHVWSSKVETYL